MLEIVHGISLCFSIPKGLPSPFSQLGKLLKATYHRRSMYRYTEARIELVKNSKSIRSKLSVWLGTEYTWALI